MLLGGDAASAHPAALRLAREMSNVEGAGIARSEASVAAVPLVSFVEFMQRRRSSRSEGSCSQ